jgi:microfibrillar-associated protein 1
MPPKRMTANPIKPARHRPGKPTGAEESSSSDSSDSETETPAIAPPPKASSAKRIASHIGKVDLDARRREAQAAEEKRRIEEQAIAAKLAADGGFVTESESEEDGDEEEGDEDSEEESGEEDSSEEEEAPRRLMIRPKFIPKSQRGPNSGEGAQPTLSLQEQEEKEAAEEEARRKQEVDQLVEEQIKKNLAARQGGKKHWDDEGQEDADVDDRDGLDPEAELAAFKLRKLKRYKRDREAMLAREREIEEIDRRRNLTEEERQAEDEQFLAKQKEEKDSKGKMAYMQKYFHKGAFFQEEAKAAGLDKRDIMGTRIADDIRDRSVLPEYLQRRDMTKLGKKGGTRYKDMRSEDTGQWGDLGDNRPRGDRYYHDGDERFRPDSGRGDGVKGANAIPLGERREQDGDRDRDRDRPRGSDRDRDFRDRSRDRDTSRTSRPRDDNRRGHSRSRSRSRSRSPRKSEQYRRKRSTSRERGRDDDKRRRIESR